MQDTVLLLKRQQKGELPRLQNELCSSLWNVVHRTTSGYMEESCGLVQPISILSLDQAVISVFIVDNWREGETGVWKYYSMHLKRIVPRHWLNPSKRLQKLRSCTVFKRASDVFPWITFIKVEYPAFLKYYWEECNLFLIYSSCGRMFCIYLYRSTRHWVRRCKIIL